MKWNYGLRVKAIPADWTAKDSHKLCSEKDAFDRDTLSVTVKSSSHMILLQLLRVCVQTHVKFGASQTK